MSAAPRIALRARLELWLWRHGAALPLALALAGAAVAVAALGGSFGSGQPAAAVVGARVPIATVGTGASDAEALAAFHALLRPADEATAQVRRLVTLTQPALAWQRAEFQQSEDAAPGVLRLQITVPVSGEYAAVRSALHKALREMPQLSLDQVRLQREAPAGAMLDTRLRFSLWLSAPQARQ